VKKPKDNLPTKAAVNVPTPLDLARVKFDRDRAFNQAMIAERQAQVHHFIACIDDLRLFGFKCLPMQPLSSKKSCEGIYLRNSSRQRS
jgi:hypothetical protein